MHTIAWLYLRFFCKCAMILMYVVEKSVLRLAVNVWRKGPHIASAIIRSGLV